jgi:hypothetical protein
MAGRAKAMESAVSNVETVKAIYQAFGCGDVAAILDKLDESVEWVTMVPVPEVPWLQARRGKANIGGFFESMAPLQITRFEPPTAPAYPIAIAKRACMPAASSKVPTRPTCRSSSQRSSVWLSI